MGTKIELPEFCNPLTGSWYKKPQFENCDHDFQRDSKWEDEHCCHWSCSRCGGIRCYEIWD